MLIFFIEYDSLTDWFIVGCYRAEAPMVKLLSRRFGFVFSIR
jgi:hypothetical protein